MDTAPRVFGILNVTPDSFSDGGRFTDAAAAVARGIELADLGADVVDVGGESTRPGARRVPPEEERARVMPVVNGLVEAGVTVSIDTMNASTALAATRAGASVVNDVSGGLADPEMYRVVAEAGVQYIAMHWRGHSDRMESLAHYGDVVTEVRAELEMRLDALLVEGVPVERVMLDPGIGFAKTAEQNWQVLARLDELAGLGRPIMVGVSRKTFLGEITGRDDIVSRDLPTAVISALAAAAGAEAVRVHDVPSTRQALATWSAWRSGGAP